MIKKIFFIVAFILNFCGTKAQIYVYDGAYIHEKIILYKDGCFKYTFRGHRYKTDVTGNWLIYNDSVLVLDSHPQIPRIIVNEIFSSNGKGAEINVWEQNGNPCYDFNLTVISTENDTIDYLVFDLKPVRTDFNIKEFYLKDCGGYKTETYKVANGNTFDIIYNNTRVFEKEHWIIKNKYIIPKGKDKNYVKYRMYKIEE